MKGDGWQDHGFHTTVVLNFNNNHNNKTSPDCTSPVSMLYWRRKLTSYLVHVKRRVQHKYSKKNVYVGWKKLFAYFKKCLLFWTVLYILLMRYAWEVKRNHYWNCKYTFFKLLPSLEGGKEKTKGGVFLEHFKLAIKWSPMNQMTILLPLMSRNNMSFFQESVRWGLELARMQVLNQILLLVLKFLMIFNVSTFLSHVWNFYIVIFSSCLG